MPGQRVCHFLGGIDAVVLEVQPFYVSWQLLDANLT